MSQVAQSPAGGTGQILNYSSPANDAGVCLDTAERWITVSDRMFAALSWWASQSGTPREPATLVHGGDESCTRNGIAVRPWFSM
jgi:hypothetical protein